MFDRARQRRRNLTEDLRRLPLLAPAPERQLVALARVADVLVLPEGFRLVTEGQRVREFFAVIEGEVAVRARWHTVRVLGPGDWSGVLGALRGGTSETTLVTITPARVLSLGIRELRAALDTVDGFARRLLTDVADDQPAAPARLELATVGGEPVLRQGA